jgi:hypothetical protein
MAEEEEKNYPRNGPKLKYQENFIKLLSNKAKVKANGTLEKPFNVFVTGYWSFEQFADDLPSDYIPNYGK